MLPFGGCIDFAFLPVIIQRHDNGQITMCNLRLEG
jgi:hypothetical protein